MALKMLFQAMAELVRLHKELRALSLEKTELLKSNDMEAFSLLLKKESKLARLIEKTEQERQQAAQEFMNAEGGSEENGMVTMNDVLDRLTDSYKEPLLTLRTSLLQEITKLQEQETLNRTMINDSLQFVQLTLDLIQPDPEAVHYSRPGDQPKKQRSEGFSTFDSKA
ncbi:flagellar protein FlgN [Alteribacillus sp. HJP-4]|uniref:flagellar protein FlgN n=1 Tax=Alteribacillus sp. HJP-4 TaxID=2775394 RepID=UPI0035CCC8D3